jgi:hypothetical protein
MTHKHHYSMKNFIHDVGHVTKPLHKDIVGLVSGAGKTFNHVVDTQASVANNLIHTSGSTLSSLSLPLLVFGGGVLLFMLTKK